MYKHVFLFLITVISRFFFLLFKFKRYICFKTECFYVLKNLKQPKEVRGNRYVFASDKIPGKYRYMVIFNKVIRGFIIFGGWGGGIGHPRASSFISYFCNCVQTISAKNLKHLFLHRKCTLHNYAVFRIRIRSDPYHLVGSGSGSVSGNVDMDPGSAKN